MSDFFSSEAEQALMGQEADVQLIFNDQRVSFEATTPYIDEDSTWAHAHTSDSGFDYFHPQPHASVPPYLTFPSSSEFNLYSGAEVSGTGSSTTTDTATTYAPSVSSTSSITSSHYTPSSLSIPFVGSSTIGEGSQHGRSRSPSPHPPDLYNYGTLNPDNRTWRCAYPGCNSKAIFARPCDLRKHFHRHNKKFFCRHEGCSQATEGGFSSKKDRTRHESKHNPGVKCEWRGCERIFSRVDNMRNHIQRIHLRSK